MTLAACLVPVGLPFQDRALICRSRELEGDGGGGEEERGTPSCSLISFAEFNYGAIKNKVRLFCGHKPNAK